MYVRGMPMWLIVVMFATMRRGVDGISVFGDR